MQTGNLAVSGDRIRQNRQIGLNTAWSAADIVDAANTLSMQFFIKCAWVACPLGQDEWPGTGMGGSNAGQSCDGLGKSCLSLRYNAANDPIRLAICNTRQVCGCDPGLIVSTARKSVKNSTSCERMAPMASGRSSRAASTRLIDLSVVVRDQIGPNAREGSVSIDGRRPAGDIGQHLMQDAPRIPVRRPLPVAEVRRLGPSKLPSSFTPRGIKPV